MSDRTEIPPVAPRTVAREKTSEPPKHELHSCNISYTVMKRRIASNSLDSDAFQSNCAETRAVYRIA